MRQRGVALVVAMLTALVLATLSGAFVVVNRDNFRLLANTQAQRGALQAIQSGLSYAQMRLDSEPGWGIPKAGPAPPFGGSLTPLVDATGLKVYENNYAVVGVLDDAAFEIYFLPDPSHTDMALYGRFVDANLLEAPASWSRAAAPDLASRNRMNVPANAGVAPAGLRNLPPGCANLLITGYCSGTRVVLDTTLRRRYLIDASMLSVGDMALQGASLKIQSQDKTVNRVRSLQSLYAPLPDSVAFGTGSDPIMGSAITNGTIKLGGSTSISESGPDFTISNPSGHDLGLDAAYRQNASAISKGSYTPNSTERVSVPDLLPEDLRSPIGASHQVAGGTYHFVDANKVLWWPDANHPIGDTASAQTFTDNVKDGAGSNAIRLRNYTFEVPDQNLITLNGTTSISGVQNPTVALGYRADASVAADSIGQLKVKGDVTVDGAVVGAGALLAVGDGGSEGNLKVRGKSQLASNPDLQVTLYGKGTVRLEQAQPPAAVITEDDWNFTHEALNQFEDQNPVDNVFTTGPGGGLNGWLGQQYGTQSGYVTSNGTDTDANLGNGGIRDMPVSGDVAGWEAIFQRNFPTVWPDVQSTVHSALTTFHDGGAGVDAGFSYGRYTRVRDFLIQATQAKQSGTLTAQLATLQSDYLDPNLDNSNNEATITNLVSYFAQQAASKGQTLRAYFAATATNPYTGLDPQGVDFRGLVYARKNFLAHMNSHPFRVEGALVSRGNLGVMDATTLLTIYNQAFVKSLLADSLSSGTIASVDVIYWNLR